MLRGQQTLCVPAQFYSNASPTVTGRSSYERWAGSKAGHWQPYRTVPWPCSSLFLRALVRRGSGTNRTSLREHILVR